MTKFEEMVDKHIGYIYSEEGIYSPDEITFTIIEGERIEIGDIVCIKHPTLETPVFYQVVEVPVRRKARDFEEDLARIGQPLIDETRNYPRARAKQVGFIADTDKLLKGEADIDDLVMLIEHIKPLSKVFRPKPFIIDKLLEPTGPSIEVGKIYPNWRHIYRFDLRKLLRQGLLVVGGIGTGKTTTMLAIVIRLIKAFKDEKLKGNPHILIIDKDGEYGPKELVDLVGVDNYVRIYIDDISEEEVISREAFAWRLLRELGYSDRRKQAARELYDLILSTNFDIYELTPEFVEKNILPLIRSRPNIYSEIMPRFTQWKQRYLRDKTGKVALKQYSIKSIIELIREKNIVHIDLSKTRDYDHAYGVLAEMLKLIYETALRDQSFGCVIVMDEAHLYAPERGGVTLVSNEDIVNDLRSILHVIATTGPRNGVTMFIATQRPSLISKTITTQMGQNIIAHRVEDVDLERIMEIMGPIAREIRVLPRGWAIVKGLAAKLREPLIVRIDREAYPESTGKTAYDRFLGKRE